MKFSIEKYESHKLGCKKSLTFHDVIIVGGLQKVHRTSYEDD